MCMMWGAVEHWNQRRLSGLLALSSCVYKTSAGLLLYSVDWRAQQLTEEIDKTALHSWASIYHEAIDHDSLLKIIVNSQVGYLIFCMPVHLKTNPAKALSSVPNFNSMMGHNTLKEHLPHDFLILSSFMKDELSQRSGALLSGPLAMGYLGFVCF